MRIGRWTIWAVVGLVVSAAAFFGVRAVLADDDRPAAAPATATADRGEVTAQVATTGTVQPAQTRTLSFTAAGKVESVKVSAGTVVTAGQVLASIDNADAAEAVDTARDNVDAAEDALTSARAAAEKSSTTTAGCNVTAAFPAPSASSSPRPSAGASPSASATSGPAEGGTRPQPSATTKAQNCTQQTGQGGTGSGGAGQNGGGDQILTAQQRLHQAEQTLADAEDALDGTTITAPMAGRVLSVEGKVGTAARAGSAFISLAGAGLEISADFPEADAGRLAPRQKATVTVAGQAEDVGATVVQVDPAGTDDGTMVRYGVLLSFDSAPAGLLIGQRAALRVTTGSAGDVLRVPSTAVHDVTGDEGTVLRGGATVTVGVGLRGDTYTEITSGLAEGDVVSRSW